MHEQALSIGGQRMLVSDHRFAQAVAIAHQRRERPLCLCVPNGAPLYVARLDGGYIVKRMPETGHLHAPDCPHYEPTADEASLGHVMGTAIQEDPDTGLTTLKLDFALNRLGPRLASQEAVSSDASAHNNGVRLSLGGLLRYLWHEAQLDHWHPAFEGKRNWGTVRRRLLQAARHKMTHSGPLIDRLYIPEPFYVEQRESIKLRRVEQWRKAQAGPGRAQALMLLIGELKEIVPVRSGCWAIVRHVPDRPFFCNEGLYRRMRKLCESEMAGWVSAESLRIVMVATFAFRPPEAPVLAEVSLMSLASNWAPVCAAQNSPNLRG